MEDDVTPTEVPPELPPEDEDEGLLDKLRDMPVGTEDPNIIGDAGPTDVPPGPDPPRAPREQGGDELLEP